MIKLANARPFGGRSFSNACLWGLLLLASLFHIPGFAQTSATQGRSGNPVAAGLSDSIAVADNLHTRQRETDLTSAIASTKHFIPVNSLRHTGTEEFRMMTRAIQEAERILNDLPNRKDYASLLGVAFGNAGSSAASFGSRITMLQAVLSANGLNLPLELRRENELGGVLAAYAASSPDGNERIYVNMDWVSRLASPMQLASVLLEEAGHAIDRRLNGAFDAKGDEGAIFAAHLSNRGAKSLLSSVYEEDDCLMLAIDSVAVSVECATAGKVSLVFVDGYIGTIGNNAQKNNYIKSFNTLKIVRATFSQDDSDGDGLFTLQGNDLPGTLTLIMNNDNVYNLSATMVWNAKSGFFDKNSGIELLKPS